MMLNINYQHKDRLHYIVLAFTVLISCTTNPTDNCFLDYDVIKKCGINQSVSGSFQEGKSKYLKLVYLNEKLDEIYLYSPLKRQADNIYKVFENDSVSVFKRESIDITNQIRECYLVFNGNEAVSYKFTNDGVTDDSLVYCRVVKMKKNSCVGNGGLIRQKDTSMFLTKLLTKKDIPMVKSFYGIAYDNRLDDKFTFLKWLYLKETIPKELPRY
ncbi:MAG: hypothetical protein V4577_24360 [Bacteroidota bacterium]